MRTFIVALVLMWQAIDVGAAASLRWTAPVDPLMKQQWNLRMVKAPAAWKTTQGRGATVAVLDTGVDLGHPDLRANLLRGIDLIDGDRRPRDEAISHGHGTHVAGIIAAARNGTGIVGVAPQAKILPVRVCSSDCSLDAIADGIRYAANRGADVINISIATWPVAEVTGENQRIRDSILYASEKGVVTVAAAGNQSLPICREPAASSLCVGTINPNKGKPLYSNFDATLRSRYLVAPGGTDVPECDTVILSTFPRTLSNACGPKGYEGMNGTSMAAPHVAGVAALLASVGLQGQEITHRLLDSCEDLGLPGRDPVFGYGLVDARSALSPSS